MLELVDTRMNIMITYNDVPAVLEIFVFSFHFSILRTKIRVNSFKLEFRSVLGC